MTLSHLGGWTAPKQADLLDLAQAVEDAGADQVVLSEHVALGATITGHPGARPKEKKSAGAFPFPPDEEYPEPLVALVAIAAITQRVRLSTNILIAPLRPAVLLAKMAATVDVLSGGRLDLGVGSGWLQREFAALGVPYHGLAARMDDTIGACRVLWEGGPSTYTSDTVSFADLYCSPAPVQARVPVWFGGTPSVSTARRVVTLGDGWSPIGGTDPDDIADGVARIHAAAAEVGRDPAEIDVRASLPLARDRAGHGDLTATLGPLDEFVGAGAGWIQLPPLGHFAGSVGEAAQAVRHAVDHFEATELVAGA